MKLGKPQRNVSFEQAALYAAQSVLYLFFDFTDTALRCFHQSNPCSN